MKYFHRIGFESENQISFIISSNSQIYEYQYIKMSIVLSYPLFNYETVSYQSNTFEYDFDPTYTCLYTSQANMYLPKLVRYVVIWFQHYALAFI